MERFTRLPLVALLIIILLVSSLSAAGNQDGGLNSKLLAKLKLSFEKDSKDQALYNALTANDIKKLALDHDKLIAHNTHFSNTIKTGKITNQKSSGRCWLFAGLNFLRPSVLARLEIDDLQLSHNYLFFYDKLEKSNTFLETIIEMRDRKIDDRELVLELENPVGDGGWWAYVAALVSRYGIVPEEVMPETYATSHTSNLNKLLNRKLRIDASKLRTLHKQGKRIEDLRKEKEMMLEEIYRILAMNFGEPPMTFEWRYEEGDSLLTAPEEYTPQQFFEEVFDLNLDQYVGFVNFPGKEYFKLYELDRCRNVNDWENARLINLPIDSLKKYSVASILDSEVVWFACDIGKSNYSDEGVLREGIYDFYSVYGIDFTITKEERLFYLDSYATHAMIFTGVDTTGGEVTKWRVENSWGDKRGDDGYWTMYEDWFDEYIYVVIINRKYLPEEVIAILDTEPVLLPVWDPIAEFIRGKRVNR